VSTAVPRAGSDIAVDFLARRLGVIILVASVLFVIYSDEFPFDFQIPSDGIWREIGRTFTWEWNPHDPGYVDRSQNILFFVPLGFGLASVIAGRRFGVGLQLTLAVILGAILSTTLELAQTLISFRNSAFADIWCNALGTFVGAAIFRLVGERTLRRAAGAIVRLRPLATPRLLWGLLGLYLAALVVVHVWLRGSGDLRGWANDVPIVIGNRAENDKPWEGTIYQVAMADQSATVEQALELSGGRDPRAALGSSLLGFYRLVGNEPYRDLCGRLHPLKWAESTPHLPATAPVRLRPDYWLITDGSIAAAMRQVRKTSQFSAAFVASTTNPDQSGPGRIISIADSRKHNFTIAQYAANLSLQARTSIGSTPLFEVRDVFADSAAKHILTTLDRSEITVYVNGVEKGWFRFTPQARFVWLLYPRQELRLPIGPRGRHSYAAIDLIYRLFIYAPLAAFLAATLAVHDLRPSTRLLAAIGMLAGIAAVLEMILCVETSELLHPQALLISLGIGVAILAAMQHRQSKTRRGPQSSSNPISGGL
jgi:VanZ family protein